MKPCASRAPMLLYPLLAFPFLTHALVAEVLDVLRFDKRDTNKTVIPAPISVAPSQYWDGNDGPWSSFPLQIGNHVQNVRVMISTAGYNVWAVDPRGCPSFYESTCTSDRGTTFNSNDSLTWVPLSTYGMGLEQNLGLDTAGDFGYDTVTLGWQGSGGPTDNHTVVGTYADPLYWIGQFGVKPIPTNFSSVVNPQPSFMQNMKNWSLIPSQSYGYTAGNQYRLSTIFGSLTLGGYDSARFDSTKNVSFVMGQDISRDLVVGIQSITTPSTSQALTQSSGGFYAYIDSTIPYLYLPVSVCQAFEAAFGLQWNSTLELYIVNGTLHQQLLTSDPSVTFTLGAELRRYGGQTVDITLPYSAFDLNVSFPILPNIGDTQYYFPLRQAANESQYTLGRAFLQEAYLIADYERGNFTIAPCVWNANMNSQIKTIYEPGVSFSNGKSGFPAGAIAGVVVGIIAVIAILCGVLLSLRKKNKQKKQAISQVDPDEKTGGTDSPTTTATDVQSARPHISKPFGGELSGDAAVHEMDQPNHPWKNPAEMDSPHKMDPNKAGYNEVEGDEYFRDRKGGPRFGHQEMEGNTPVYEMPAGEIHEMATPENTTHKGDMQ